MFQRTGARHLFDAMPQEAAAAGIDAVPDEALQHVLGFLPAQEAVLTCVLARRWRHLWRSIPALRITSGGCSRMLTEQELHTLNRFVSDLLLLRDRRAPLDLCEFHIEDLIHSDELEYCESPRIDIWIQQALLCKARTLRVKYDDDYPLLHDLLISQHLTVLELAWLMLRSRFRCPALKKLVMTACSVDAEKISSPSLQQLSIIDCEFENFFRTRISFPGLVCLELTDNYDKTPLLESMPSLVKAFVRLHGCDDRCGKEVFGHSCYGNNCDFCANNGDGSTDSVLLNGLSETESLELVAEPRMHTPVLEKLILQLRQAPNDWVATKGSYNPSKWSFASKKLKVIELKCEMFDKRVRRIFSMLSTHGVSIEQINVQQTWRRSECYSFQTNEDLPGLGFYT